MKVLINGIVYDSTNIPILIEFDENEQKLFDGMKRFVSTPSDSTEEERQELIETDFQMESQEMYIILSETQPEIVDFTYYTDKEEVESRVEDLNKLARKREYWYITMYSNSRNSGKDGED